MKLIGMKKARVVLGLVVIATAAVYLLNASWLAKTGQPGTILSHRGVHQAYDRTGLNRDSCTAERMKPSDHEFLENTVPSIAAAIRNGADIVEIDIHPTKDGRFAVFHDWTLGCRTDGEGVTRDQTLAYLKGLDIGYGYTADGGKTFPLRGKGVGLMPSLLEVLDAFPQGRFLINFKIKDPSEGERLANFLESRSEPVKNRLFVYGGEQPTTRALSLVKDLRGFTKSSLKSCAIKYIALGWVGYVPQECRETMLVIPANYTRYLWGWPNRFVQRMNSSGSDVFVAGDFQADGTGGIDDLKSLEALRPIRGFGIWTNRVELVGPALLAEKGSGGG
jgi:glycerophosphoryl diester phosphodiesterase